MVYERWKYQNYYYFQVFICAFGKKIFLYGIITFELININVMVINKSNK
jgi:hypothetical protein